MPRFLLLASDATLAALIGACLLVVSLLCALGERQRRRRRDIDRVGLMPWRDLAAFSLFAGLILLAMGQATCSARLSSETQIAYSGRSNSIGSGDLLGASDHRTAARLQKKGLYPEVSGAPKAA